MSFWSRLFGGKAKGAEGEHRPGPYRLDDGWLPVGAPLNFWQMGQNVRPHGGMSAMVEACVSAYSQTVAMCPGDHWLLGADGGRSRVTNSALSRILRRPNDYQSISDFLLNLTRASLDHGDGYAVAIRNNRGEVSELHLMGSRQCFPRIAEDGSIFYAVGGNEVFERRFGAGQILPARDVLHLRMHTPRHPLKGETPLMAAALDLATRDAGIRQQLAFFENQARPSFLLSTDEKMAPQQAMELRDAWNRQTRGENAGGTPILTAGLKPHALGSTATDAQLAETLKMSDQSVALAFRVPLQILGIGGTPFASTEALMQSWVASGLGFVLNHIEEAFGQLFRLQGVPVEYVEFSTKALLRSAFRDRIEGLARGVQTGIFSPDEARAEEELPKVPGGYGQEPRVQAQVVPLSAWEKGQVAEPTPAAPAAPSASSDAPPETEVDDTERAVAAVRMKFAGGLYAA